MRSRCRRWRGGWTTMGRRSSVTWSGWGCRYDLEASSADAGESSDSVCRRFACGDCWRFNKRCLRESALGRKASPVVDSAQGAMDHRLLAAFVKGDLPEQRPTTGSGAQFAHVRSVSCGPIGRGRPSHGGGFRDTVADSADQTIRFGENCLGVSGDEVHD